MPSPWSKHFRGSFLVVPFAVLFLLAGLAPIARGQTSLVYVTSNIYSPANQNSVLAWTNDGAGNLTPVPGSPFLTGGTGYNDPTGPSHLADNMLIIDAKHLRLLTVNPDTNTIAEFSINSDGSLTTIPGSPFPSGGQEPLSLALSPFLRDNGQQILTVVNTAGDPNQETGPASMNTFLVKANGNVVPTPMGSVTLGVNAAPTSVRLANPAGSQITMVQTGGTGEPSQVFIYGLNSNGIMTQLGSAGAGAQQEFVGAVLHPTAPILYVGYPSSTAFNVYSHNRTTGALTYISTVPAAGLALCWLSINSAGTRLYTVQSDSSSVTVYDVTHPQTPVQIQNLVLNGTSNFPTELAFDPTGNFMYVLGVGLLHVLNVNPSDGTLSEIITPVNLNLPANTEAMGVATLLR